MIGTIAWHQIRSFRRHQTFMATFAILLAMTALAGVLGWSSHHTIARVYDQAATLLADSGKPAPPNPFVLKPALSLLSNMVVYIPLIGALIALVLGHMCIVDDEVNGIGRLVFSRHVKRSGYILGKVASVAVVLAVILAACALVEVLSVAIINRALSVDDLIRLGLFSVLSWLYVLSFALIGIVTVLLVRTRSLALLAALGIWMAITFVVPQVTSGLRPTQSLNPITDPANTTQAFFRVTSKLRPYSLVEQFKGASGRILQTTAAEPTLQTIHRVVVVAATAIGLTLLAVLLVRRHDFSRSVSNG